jgi:hypothetical protein
MSRSTLLCFTLAVAGLAVACDGSGAETQARIDQANSAAAAAAAVAEAGATASAKIQGAESHAAETIAAAQADFATTREDFRHKTQSDLDGLQRKMDEMDAKAKVASGNAKSDLDDTMPALRRQRDSFVSDFHSIDSETAATWDATRARLEREWAQLKTAVDKAA